MNAKKRKIAVQKYFHQFVSDHKPLQIGAACYTYNANVNGDTITFNDINNSPTIIIPDNIGQFSTVITIAISDAKIYIDDKTSYPFDKLEIKY